MPPADGQLTAEKNRPSGIRKRYELPDISLHVLGVGEIVQEPNSAAVLRNRSVGQRDVSTDMPRSPLAEMRRKSTKGELRRSPANEMRLLTLERLEPDPRTTTRSNPVPDGAHR